MATVVTKPEVDISPVIKKLIKHSTEEMGQVVIHFSIDNPTGQDIQVFLSGTGTSAPS